MRVISGKYKGLILNGNKIIGTRPTMDRVKESMFGTIQNYIPNSICLDLFAGSGSLGIEAISNGAEEVYFVDKNIIAINTIKSNINSLKAEEKVYYYNEDYLKALLEFKRMNLKFDLIFLDPPYSYEIIEQLLQKIKEYELLNVDGIIICEYEKDTVNTNLYKLIKNKKISSKTISYFKNC